ncbi:hypothetical protein TYRP_006394 [Tyrophagus putrescentiae]|nr:hypothetical protein TYRP_006394 [Tyrophagus putrescentiae]
MKSLTPFCSTFFLLLIFLFLPYLSQQLPWNDHHLRAIPLTPQTVASVDAAFARFTHLMETFPQLYGQAVIFSHFYQQLWDCTEWEENINQVHLKAECHAQLLSFLQDLGLLPELYRLRAGLRLQLEEDWHSFLERNPPPEEESAVMPSVPDRPVVVPPEQLPLLEGCPNLQLTRLPEGGGATTSYSSLMAEFMRNQKVYATKTSPNRKKVAFYDKTALTRSRLLKLRAIFLLMVGVDFVVLVPENSAGAQQVEPQQQQQPPEPPPFEIAVAEEEQPQQHPLPSASPVPSPHPQQVPWDDHHLRTLQLIPQTVASVDAAFAHFTQQMEAHPQLYGYAVLFAHFYLQLVDCTVWEEDNQVYLRVDCYAQLLTFLQDLGLLPQRYQSQAGARRPQLEEDWQTFISVNPPQVEQGGVMPLVNDHQVVVPPEQLPLLEGCPNLQLTRLPEGEGATTSYSSLMAEFMHNQEVVFYDNSALSRHRLLKLRAIFLLVVDKDFVVLVPENAGAKQVEPQQQPQQPEPPPPPVEEAVVEEEEEASSSRST